MVALNGTSPNLCDLVNNKMQPGFEFMTCVTIFITLTADLVDILHKLVYIFCWVYNFYFVCLMVKIIMSAY